MDARFALRNNVPVDLFSQQNVVFAIASTISEQDAINEITGFPILPEFRDALTNMQKSGYSIDGIIGFFGRFRIPLGLISTLLPLKDKTLHFKIDDSTSMTWETMLTKADASDATNEFMQKYDKNLSRWVEAQDRLHKLMQLLAFIPTGPIIISLFDRENSPGKIITLQRKQKSPEEFLREAKSEIQAFFIKDPAGNTPILFNMRNMLASQRDVKAINYFLTDGEPSGANEKDWIKELLKKEEKSDNNQFQFLGCSNKPNDYEWIHEVAEIAEGVASVSNYHADAREVQENQGERFPYNEGMWLIRNLVAVYFPDDLNALSKHVPLTKPALEKLFGRGIMPEEFRAYFQEHPRGHKVFAPSYQQFLTTPCFHHIPAVKVFLNQLSGELDEDAHGKAQSEEEILECAAEAVCKFYQANSGSIAGHSAGLFTTVPASFPAPDDDRCCTCSIV